MPVTLTLQVVEGQEDHLYDAVNETLNDLARVGVLADANDDGWEWTP